MADNQRVPPAVLEKFKEAAIEVCKHAKLDYDDWNLHSEELVIHLEERWKEGVEKGMNTDDAEKRALAMFGDRSQVAKSLRKPWYERSLLYERFQPERYFFFLAAYVFYSWLAVLDVHYRAYLNGESTDITRVMLPFDSNHFPWDFFRNGLGTFFVGLAAVGCVVVIRWQPMFKIRWLNQLLVLRFALAVITLFSLYELVVQPVRLCYLTFRYYQDSFVYQGYCGLHVAAIFLGWFGAACLVSELCVLPRREKRRQAQSRPFGVSS